jgi:hypothetical protein
MLRSRDLPYDLSIEAPGTVGGEPLDGSGFEPEEPDSGLFGNEQEVEE